MDLKSAVAASADVEQRRRYVDNALGSLRIEGLEIDAPTCAIAERYVVGEISREEMTQAILQLR